MENWLLLSFGVGLPLIAFGAAYHTLIRTQVLHWGCVGDEATGYLPGDEMGDNQCVTATHAIAIQGAPQDVWPWLVQMGQGRGGFYSYAWLENLVGCRMKNATRINPEWQELAVGDLISIHPRATPLRVEQLEPERVLVLGTDSPIPWNWSFVVTPTEDGSTRLLARMRVKLGSSWLAFLTNYLILEPGHFVMEQKMLRTIKQRVESKAAD